MGDSGYRETGALAQAARNYILSRTEMDLRVLDRLAAVALRANRLLTSPADLTATCATGAEPVGEPSAPTGAHQAYVMSQATKDVESMLTQETAEIHAARRIQVIDSILCGRDDVIEVQRIADEFDGITQGPITCACRK